MNGVVLPVGTGRLTEQHEEQRADQRGHDDQQREADALPHLSGRVFRSQSAQRGGLPGSTGGVGSLGWPGHQPRTAAHRTLTPAS